MSKEKYAVFSFHNCLERVVVNLAWRSFPASLGKMRRTLWRGDVGTRTKFLTGSKVLK